MYMHNILLLFSKKKQMKTKFLHLYNADSIHAFGGGAIKKKSKKNKNMSGD